MSAHGLEAGPEPAAAEVSGEDVARFAEVLDPVGDDALLRSSPHGDIVAEVTSPANVSGVVVWIETDQHAPAEWVDYGLVNTHSLQSVASCVEDDDSVRLSFSDETVSVTGYATSHDLALCEPGEHSGFDVPDVTYDVAVSVDAEALVETYEDFAATHADSGSFLISVTKQDDDAALLFGGSDVVGQVRVDAEGQKQQAVPVGSKFSTDELGSVLPVLPDGEVVVALGLEKPLAVHWSSGGVEGRSVVAPRISTKGYVEWGDLP